MRAFITDPEGEDAYPIATFTWMLFYKDGQDPQKVEAIKQMVEYGLTDGQAMADGTRLHPDAGRGDREGPRLRPRGSAPAS